MSTSTSYNVQGMTCSGCAGKVTGAVTGVDGVTDARIDLATGTVTVSGQGDRDAVRAAIRDAGYQVS